MDPSVGHLYHDSSISGTFTAIDAKEQLRMRAINAREQRHLDHENYLIDRAKSICERSRKWEQLKLQRQMRTLQDRTQPLDFLLKQEAQSYNRNRYEGKFITTLPSLVNKNGMLADVSPKAKSADTYKKKPDSGSKSNSLKIRSNKVVRKLGQLYDRTEERKKHPNFRLSPAQIHALEQARVALRGTGAEADVDRLLAKAQGVQPWKPVKRTSIVSTLLKTNISSSSSHRSCQVNSSSSSQSMSEDEICAQSKGDSSVVRTRFPKLPQFSNQKLSGNDTSDSVRN